jgi:inactive STAND/Effector-associated domain 9
MSQSIYLINNYMSNIDALESQLNILDEKLKELRTDSAYETDISKKFQLKHQIEEVEQDIRDIENSLENLIQEDKLKKLYNSLLRLGYRKQISSFRDFIETESMGAFLIYPSQEEKEYPRHYGQEWLLHRLIIKHLPRYTTAKVLRVDFSRVGRQNDISSLWREVASKFGLGRHSTKHEIADRVYKLWQNQHVLITFHNFDFLNEQHFQDLLQDFWQLLSDKIKSSNNSINNSYQLLMFLINYTGSANDWNIPFIEEYNPNLSVDKPVKLPELAKFQDDELIGWINNEVDTLPKQLFRDVKTMAKNILDSSEDGIPEFTLEEICCQCGCEWHENKERWLGKY